LEPIEQLDRLQFFGVVRESLECWQLSAITPRQSDIGRGRCFGQAVDSPIVRKRDPMNPADYAENYLHFAPELYDGVVEVPIDKYLNAGITGKNDKTPHPNDYRANRAIGEKDQLLGAIKQDLKIHGHIPPLFQVEGYLFKLLDVVMPFFGKGSPSNLRDVFWLASKYKRVTAATARDYSTKYLGLDCNGFVGNFWGINPSTPIESYDKNRRRQFDDVDVGDALIFYHKGTTHNPYHIATINQVEFINTTNEKTPSLSFWITQSAGLEDGVRTTLADWKLSKTAHGDVVHETANTTVYIVAGPEKGTPRGLVWAVSDVT
jgi:hypothetical protein